MAKYSVTTDSFIYDDFEAESLDEAIREAFEGEGLGKIVDRESLERIFQKYADDGGWCSIEEDGVEVLMIGTIG